MKFLIEWLFRIVLVPVLFAGFVWGFVTVAFEYGRDDLTDRFVDFMEKP